LKRILDTIGIFSLGAMFGVVLGGWLATDFNIATHEQAEAAVWRKMRASCQQWYTTGHKEIVACFGLDWGKK
jgi:fucose permease